MTDIPLPAFDRPPVGEVVFGVGFDPIPNFRLPHLGLYWATVKDQFERCEHAPPLGPIEEISDPTLGFPIPRVWLIHKNQDHLIQLQSNWYFFNWRKMEANPEYPHYKNIKPLFNRNLTHFFKFLVDEGFEQPEPRICELTYINKIPKGEGWEAISDIENVIPDLRWRDRTNRFLPEPKEMSWHTAVNLPEDSGVLTVRLQSASEKPSGQQILRLEISARGIGDDHSMNGVLEWLDLAHEWIVRGFVDLTSREAQIEYWKRTDVRP